MSERTISAYPLSWPDGYQRTRTRVSSRFNKNLTIAKAADELERELELLETKDIILSTNIPLKLSGGPKSGFNPEDPGAAVYFKRKNKDLVLSCDSYNRVQDNIHAIARTINSLRQISRDGVSDFLERAFTGFTAIPQTAGPSHQAWWEILGVKQDCSYDEAYKKYLELAKIWHPDSGDNSGRFYLLQEAWSRAKAHFGKD
jgi:DnaJ domain